MYAREEYSLCCHKFVCIRCIVLISRNLYDADGSMYLSKFHLPAKQGRMHKLQATSFCSSSLRPPGRFPNCRSLERKMRCSDASFVLPLPDYQEAGKRTSPRLSPSSTIRPLESSISCPGAVEQVQAPPDEKSRLKGKPIIQVSIPRHRRCALAHLPPTP